jgi:uncharacterized protein
MRHSILAFDGGGVRGAFTASVVSELSSNIPAFTDKFDIVAGTSTGAIIAALIVMGKSSEEVLDLYTHHAKEIFWQNPLRLQGAISSKYDQSVLHTLMEKHFGSTVLGDLDRRLFVVASNINQGKIQLFDSRLDAHKKLKLKDVVLASAAAPSFFDPVKVGSALYADGGIWANDPAVPVLLQLHSEGVDFGKMRVLSIGTGVQKYLYKTTTDKVPSWGILSGWEGKKIFGLIEKLQDEYTRFAVGSLLPASHYHKIDLLLEKNIDLDDYKSVEYLIAEGLKIATKEKSLLIQWLRTRHERRYWWSKWF